MINKTLKTTLILAAIILVTFSVYAFARGGRTHMGSWNNMGYGMYDGNMWNGLSTDDQTKMQESMNTFFSDTKDIREAKYNKQLELDEEYSKSEFDKEKIKGLQSEIFDLSSQFEKKRFEHRTTMQGLFGNENNRYTSYRGDRGCFNYSRFHMTSFWIK